MPFVPKLLETDMPAELENEVLNEMQEAATRAATAKK
jgi:hypothetical protein